MGWLHSTERKGLFDVPSGQQNHIVIDAFGSRPNADGMLFPDSSYANYALNGFGRNELVYACIMEKARTLPQGVLRVYSDQRVEPLEDHRLRRLIAQPNPVTNEVEFLQLSVVHLDLAGNCYWLIVRARDGLPVEMWPLRPDLIRILPTQNPRQWSYGYVIDPTTGAAGRSAEVIPVARRDVVHVKYPNPLDAYFGQPPLRASARAISTDSGRTDFVDALLRNDAVPRTVVTTQQELTEKVIDRLRSKWIRRFAGDNRGSPAFLQAGMDVKVLGLNLQDLEFGDMAGVTEARICAALGVQPILVGAKVGLDRSTFANFREAKAAFWEGTLMNLQDLFLGGIKAQVLPEFLGVGRQRISIRWDNSEVLALQEAESDRWERATNALARGGITINDFRRTVGLDPAPNGDVFLIPAGVVPSPADDIPAAEPPAEPESEMEAAAMYADRFLSERLAVPASTNGRHPVTAGRSN